MAVKYVFIPADPSETVEEREFRCPQGKDPALAFLDALKPHFKAAAGGVDAAAAAKAHRQALLQQAGENASNIDPGLLSAVSDMQMVESTPLLSNRPDTGFVAVNLYSDDSGTFKQLPLNHRANQLADACGLALQVRGDVFVGRLFDNEDDFKRLDFPLSDLSSAAPWLQQARATNLGRAARSGALQQQLQDLQARTQQQQQQQQPAGGASGGGAASRAEREKQLGNGAVGRGDWGAALDHYTAALKLDSGMVAARNNRGLAYLKLGMAREAAADCSEVLAAEPRNIKALLRRAAARERLGDDAAAGDDLQRALQLEPGNRDAQQAAQQLQQRRQQGAAAAAAEPAPLAAAAEPAAAAAAAAAAPP